MKPNEIAWSHSALARYESCPQQYYREKVTKEVPFVETEALKKGNDVHKSLELFIGNDVPLPKRHQQFQEAADWAASLPNVKVEEQFAFTATLERCQWFDRRKKVWARQKVDVQADFSDETKLVVDWKGLALDTVIPTPSGLSTMGQIRVGDEVWDKDGNICRVVGKSEVKNLRCFKVTFKSGASVICDEEHLWLMSDGRVLPVTDISSSPCRSVPAPAPLKGRRKKLPIAPFTLGLWLSDGRVKRSEITKPYPEVWEEVAREGYVFTDNDLTTPSGKATGRTIKGLNKTLRDNGLLGRKHIPEIYFHASLSQRMALARGLMNGDGSVNKVRGELVFTSCDKALSEDVARLLRTLGVRSRVHTTTQKGYGRTVTAYPLSSRLLGKPVMVIGHKRESEKEARRKHYPKNKLTDMIGSIEEVPSVPTQCIAVDSPSHTYLCSEHYIVTHNTGKYWGDDGQAALTALFMFWANPKLQQVTTVWYYLEQDKKVPGHFTRSQMPELMERPLDTLSNISQSYRTDQWPKTPGFGCKFCGVTSCEFRGKTFR